MTPGSIAITGSGLITPLGDDLKLVMERMREGQSVLTHATSPNVAIPNFEATRYASVRGMRAYSRTTQLGIAAAALAMADARIGEGQIPSEQFGLVMASTFGHLDTLLEYDFGLVTKGMERTNPALMPLAIGSAPGSATALGFRLRGCSVTLSQGAATGLDALALAARLVASGRLRACLVVGAFAPNAEAMRRPGSDVVGPGAKSRVFDAESQGMVLAESACALVVESVPSARERAATVQGLVLGHAAGFSAERGSLARTIAHTAERALARAELNPREVSLISAGANGIPAEDEAHAQALCAMFYASAPKPPVLMAPKASLGESVDAAGLLQLVTGLSALKGGVAPVIAGLNSPRVLGPRYALQTCSIEGGVLLATASSRTGSTAAMLLGPST